MSEFNFKLKCYPNPMREDGVFVAEDKPIEPDPVARTLDGPYVPPTPKTPSKRAARSA